jgi:hypothetical protein
MGKKIIQKELFLFARTQIILDSHYKGGTDFIPAGSLFGIQFGAIGTTCVKPFMIKVVMGSSWCCPFQPMELLSRH